MNKITVCVLAFVAVTLAISVVFFLILNQTIKTYQNTRSEDEHHELEPVTEKVLLVPPICDRSLITNRLDGTFFKTVCYINHNIYEPLSYENASSVCSQHGMSLYKFDDPKSFNFWLQLANLIWPTPTVPAVWVNGKREHECSGKFEIDENGKKSQMYGDLVFRDMYNCGGCLRMIQNGRNFIGTPWDCNKAMTFFCEFTMK
jgi:hypothetical protein